MDTSTIRDIGGNFPPRLPPNQLGIGRWNDKSANNRFLSNYVEDPSDFNLLGTNNYPTVVQRFTPGNQFSPRLRSQDFNNYYTGCNISAFFVLSAQSNTFNDALLGFTSSFSAMPEPLSGDRLVNNSNSTFDFTLTYNSSNIGLSRFGANTINNVVSAQYNGAYSLVSILVNGTQNTIGNVLPSTNVISINGAFVSSSSFYAGRNFNILYLSIFGGYNFTTRNTMSFNEIGIFYRTLTTPERVAYESQLIRKWGLPSNISVSTPVISGLNLWLDAYDSPSIIFSTNTSQVTQWSDKSLCNFHMSNPGTLGAARMPTYTTASPSGLPSLQFSNSAPTSVFYTNLWNSNFTYPTVRETTLFVSYASTSNTAFYGPLFTMLSNNELFYDRGNGFELSVTNGNGGIGLVRSTVRIYNTLIPNTHNTTTLASVVFNSSFTTIPDIPQRSFGLSRNGVVGFVQPSSFISSVGILSTLNFTVNQAALGTRGAGTVGDQQWYYSGFIHEVLQYNRALTFIERQQVESYLLSKWNI
jgi:hypothetical protein